MDSERMVELYLSGLNASDVARVANLTKQTVLYHLRNHGVKIRSSNEVVKRLSNTAEQVVIDEYRAGASQKKLSLKHNVNISVIINTLRKADVIIRGVRESVGYKDTIIPLDGDIFYYFLGWMLTDGWIYERKYSIILGLGSQDFEIIEFFRNHFSPGRKIYVSRTHKRNGKLHKKFYRLLLPIDETIKQELIKWGLIKRKSLILKPTKNLQELSTNNFRQLLVGMIEGDGTIFRLKKTNRLIVRYYGTKAMCDYVVTMIGYGDVYKNRKIYMAVWCGDDALKFGRSLADIKLKLLKRKWNKLN